jgi:hypothetical protein
MAALGGNFLPAAAYPVCFHCKQIITVPYLIAFGQAWHKEHLACKLCRKNFVEAPVVREGPDGFAYCDPCSQVAFAPICTGCGEKITSGDILTANNTKVRRALFFGSFIHCYYLYLAGLCWRTDSRVDDDANHGEALILGVYVFRSLLWLCFVG